MLSAPDTLLLFSAAGRHLGLPVAQISEVVPAFEMKGAPGLSAHLAGLISFRGRVLPVIDCGMIMNGTRTALHQQHSFIIARGAQNEAALLVDHVDEIVTPVESDCASDDCLHAGEQRFQRIVMHGNELVLVLDIDACLRAPREHVLPLHKKQAVQEERI